MLRCLNPNSVLISTQYSFFALRRIPALGPPRDVAAILTLSLPAHALQLGPVDDLAPVRDSDGGPADRVTVDAGCTIN